MRRFAIVVEPFGSLFVGGYAQPSPGADADTAADPLGFLLPGSAVKGALRESALRLVNALGRGDDLRRRLFGEVNQPGVLRCGTLRPRLSMAEVDTTPELYGSLRNHVSLERATREAAAQRLFQHRVTPALPTLRFEGILEASEELTGDELDLLQSAVQITDQIGGGRGRGLGLVSVALSPWAAERSQLKSVAPAESADPATDAAGASRLVLCLEAEEPLHLAGVKDLTNYSPSRDYLDGSTLRGAVAAALAEGTEPARLEDLLGGNHAAIFGDARPGAAGAVPAPLTLTVPKRGGTPLDEAARLCARACGGRTSTPRDDMRAARGTFVPDGAGWSALSIPRRIITRAARDTATGGVAQGKLFSIEVLDPGTVEPNRSDATVCRLRFYAPVTGTAAQLALVVEAGRRGLVAGGDRSYGCGRLRLIETSTEEVLPPCATRHAAWAELVGRLGVAAPEATGVLLAMGPLAVSQERLVGALEEVGLTLIEGVGRRQMYGGWNVRMRLPRTLSSHFVPGSTFVVARRAGDSALSALAQIETTGIGPGRADGWGRLVTCHPIHVDCHQEE